MIWFYISKAKTGTKIQSHIKFNYDKKNFNSVDQVAVSSALTHTEHLKKSKEQHKDFLHSQLAIL